MPKLVSRTFITLILTGSFTSAIADDKTVNDTGKVSYYTQIRPLFQAKCHGCHQPAKDKGDYIMTTFEGLLAGGESEKKAVVPGAPEKSYLFKQISANKEGEFEMPKGKDAKPLHEVDVTLVRQWNTEGARNDTPQNARTKFDADNPPGYTLPPVITSLDYSPDGSLLAVAGFHEVLLHKADGSGLVKRLIGISERIESVRFSPDGKLLASGSFPVGRVPLRLSTYLATFLIRSVDKI